MTGREEDLERSIMESVRRVAVSLDDYMKAMRKIAEQNPHMTLVEFFQIIDNGKQNVK